PPKWLAEQARVALRGLEAEVAPRRRRSDAPARGALQQAALDEERLVHVLDGLGSLTDRNRQRREADGAAGEAVAHRVEDGAVELVEAEVVDLEQRQPV